MAESLTKQDLIELLDVRFKAERVYQRSQLDEERKYQRSQLDQERAYYTQLIREEVAGIRRQLEQIERTIGEDAKAALLELDVVKERVTTLEASVAKLQAA